MGGTLWVNTIGTSLIGISADLFKWSESLLPSKTMPINTISPIKVLIGGCAVAKLKDLRHLGDGLSICNPPTGVKCPAVQSGVTRDSLVTDWVQIKQLRHSIQILVF